MTGEQLDIIDALWRPGQPAGTAVFVILDSARDKRIYGAVDGTRLPKDCLYSGDLPWQMQMTAPYLVQLEPQDRFTEYLLANGWGDCWGVFLRTETGIRQLRKHLRQFLRVRDEAGHRLIFRYYDPRVLRVYLPTCTAEEIETFYGPVKSFVMEGENPGEILEFRNQNGRLITRKAVMASAAR